MRLTGVNAAIEPPVLHVMHFTPSPETLVIGLGSHHGADAIGWLTARALRQLDSSLLIVEAASASDILDRMQRYDRLVICDGCQGAGLPGTVHYWRWPETDLRRLKSSGTHDLSLCDVLRLGESLGGIRDRIDVWGIEIPHNSVATDLQWLAQVASQAAAQIHAELNNA